jgi:hypothetical protein
MVKIDHRKTLKHLYYPSRTAPSLVEVQPMNFLMLDGRGKPSGSEFQQAASTLYPLAYTIKFMVRAACGVDYHVMPMEVRWRVNRQKKEFAWTMMLMQPECVSLEFVEEARQRALSKVEADVLERVRFERFAEGICVQLRHVGPYEGMDSALDRMIMAAGRQGYTVASREAHDIYLNDVRKTKPENLQAIMRLPVNPREGAYRGAR